MKYRSNTFAITECFSIKSDFSFLRGEAVSANNISTPYPTPIQAGYDRISEQVFEQLAGV